MKSLRPVPIYLCLLNFEARLTTKFIDYKLYFPLTQRIYVLCMDLRTNSDYFYVRTGFITETYCVYCEVRPES